MNFEHSSCFVSSCSRSAVLAILRSPQHWWSGYACSGSNSVAILRSVQHRSSASIWHHMPWCLNCSTDLAASFFEVYSPEWPCRDWCIRCRLANECNMHETHKLTLERQLATALLAEENARKIEALSNLLLSMNNKFQETNTHQHMHHANSSMHKQTHIHEYNHMIKYN